MLERIAEYEISGEIGIGGFGRVYKAYDPKVGREVAIKTLNDAHDPELINRFRVEAAAAGNLDHKNIVTIFEFGEYLGMHYLVMEYLPGLDLHRIIKDRPNISVLEAMTIMNQVAQGLSYAHNHGVVHRDVKPGNIMVRPDGVVKIMDFGIARLTSDAQPHLTKSGFIVGTLLYLAPEQFAGRPYDVLCDIWAFGVVYYELLTGENPFKASDDAAIMYRITAVDPAPVRAVRPDCPPELEQLINRLLMRNRDDRYQSLEDVVFDSEPILRRLREDRASDLKKVVENLLQEEQFEQAQLVVRQMLELDPANDQARRWRDELRKQVREKDLRPRVQSLVASAESELEQRRFDEASQLLQSALNLDPGNASVQRRLDSARRAKSRHDRVQTLLDQATQDLNAQNVSNALFRASEAAAADPESQAAKLLVQQIQEYADRRDRKRKLDAGLAAADELMLHGSYEQAVVLLEGLRNTYPDEPHIQEKIGEILGRQTNDRLNEQISRGISNARELLQALRFSEAAALLENLCLEFPNEPTPRELLSFATKQDEANKKQAEAEAIARQAWGLAKKSEFVSALKLVDDGLRRFSDEPILVRVRVAIRSAQARHEEEVDVKTLLELSRGLAEQGRVDEAIAAVEAGLRRVPTRPELLHLLAELQEQRVPADQAMAAQEFPVTPAPSPSWAGAPVDAGRYEPLDPGTAQAQFAVKVPQESVPNRKWWFFGGTAVVSLCIVIAAVIWISARPSRTDKTRQADTPVPNELVKSTAPVKNEAAGESEKEVAPKAVVATIPLPVERVTPARGTTRQITRDTAQPKDTKSVQPVEAKPVPPVIQETPGTPKALEAGPPPVIVSKNPWHGDDSGQMLWRGGSLAPGATVDLVRNSLEGANKFPWLTETKVQVRVISPSNVTVDAQPSRTNNWSLIRIRNNGTQLVQFVTLSWQIVE